MKKKKGNGSCGIYSQPWPQACGYRSCNMTPLDPLLRFAAHCSYKRGTHWDIFCHKTINL